MNFTSSSSAWGWGYAGVATCTCTDGCGSGASGRTSAGFCASSEAPQSSDIAISLCIYLVVTKNNSVRPFPGPTSCQIVPCAQVGKVSPLLVESQNCDPAVEEVGATDDFQFGAVVFVTPLTVIA